MSKNLWWMIAAAAALVVLIAFGPRLLGSVKSGGGVGVIDIGQVIAQSPLAQRYENELADKYKELQDQLEQERTDLDDEERQEKEKELTTEYLNLKQELEGKLEKQIDEALISIMKESNLGVIVYKESVRRGGVDVTPDVVKALK
ncbi:MAG: OmpH family outer membrane protein [Firmicutes bacterium]|nr:OmpH family outer membrane protein [Bacillota bacterium]